MKSLWLLASLIYAAHSWANLHLAPPDFDSSVGRAVFVDFTHAHHEVIFDAHKRSTIAKSTIRFTSTKTGLPIFDLVPAVAAIRVNGEPVAQQQIFLPGRVSKVRVALKVLPPGDHTLEIENAITENVGFSVFKNIKAAFWIRDLKDRLFWEQYLPVNLEFDQHPRVLDIKLVGRKLHDQVVLANGKVTQTATNSWRIEYPAWYTSSAAYFHTFRRGARRTLTFTHQSIDGREIPFTIYTFFPWSVQKYAQKARAVFDELEADYGPWLHDSFIAYGAGFGGMEHAGATMTSLGALDHEMLHCYFAKGVLPANGNAGWIDEAIASWRDNGYQRSLLPGLPANLAGRSEYARNTSKLSYEFGRNFLAHLDYVLAPHGGLKAFLKGYAQTYKYTLITTDHFINNLEFFSGLELRELFIRNVYRGIGEPKASERHNHYHGSATQGQLLRAL